MANKSLRLNIDANTTDAESGMSRLARSAEITKRRISEIGAEMAKAAETQGTGEGSSNAPRLETYIQELNKALDDNTRTFQESIEELNKTIRNSETKANTSSGGGGKKPPGGTPPGKTPNPESPKDSKKEKTEPDKRTLADTIGNAFTAAFTGKAVLGYLGAARGRSLSHQAEAQRVYGGTGTYGSNYKDARRDAKRTGISLGYNVGEVMSAEDELMAQVGFSNRGSLQKDSRQFLSTARAYGLDPSEAAGGYGTASRSGAFMQGQAEQYLSIISSSIKEGGMMGRESEQVKAIEYLTEALTSGKLEVTSKDIREIVSLQTALGNANPALKGERGAAMVGGLTESLNRDDELILRLMGYGGDAGFGIQGYNIASQRAERGLADPEVRKLVDQTANRYVGGKESEMARAVLTRSLGLSYDEYDALIKPEVWNSSDTLDLGAGKAQQSELLQKYDGSSLRSMQEYEANKDNARAATGDLTNTTIAPARGLFNMAPTGLQSVGDFGKHIVPWYAGGKMLKFAFGGISKLLGKGKTGVDPAMVADSVDDIGKSVITNSADDIGKSVITNSADDVAGAAGGKFAGLGSKFTGIGGKFIGKGGKLLGAFGKVAPFIPAAIGGVQAVGDVARGDNESAAGNLGKGLGATAGIIGGAKLGAAVGTAVATPGIGTLAGGAIGALGGLLGGVFGEGAGRGIYSALSGEDSTSESLSGENIGANGDLIKRANTLLDKQELLLKKEELLFDKFLGEGTTTHTGSIEGVQAAFGDEDNNLSSMSQTGQDILGQAMGGSSGGTTGSSGGVDPVGGDFLGKVSAKGEVNFPKGNAGTISHGGGDYGGKSYGIPQFTSAGGGASANSFVKNGLKGTEFAKYFQGAGKAGSASFDNAWKKAYNANPDGFTKAQQSFAYKNWVQPFINNAKKKYGIDLGSTRALQEMAFSSALQHGASGAMSILKNTRPGMSEEEIIKSAYAYKQNNVNSMFRSSSASVRKGVYNRFVREEKDVLGYLGQQPLKAYAIGHSNIPHDQTARLHKGEAVLDKFKAREYREGRLGAGQAVKQDVNMNLNINLAGSAQGQINPELINAIRNAVQQMMAKSGVGSPVNLSYSHVRKQF